jgi:hypothetical protein
MAMSHEPFQIPKIEFLGGALNRSLGAFKNPSVFDAAAGAVVAPIAIAGLCGFAPRTMASLALLGVGLAFVIEAAGIAARSQTLLGPESRIRSEVSGSVLTESLAGAVGFAFSFLALLGIAPYVMLALASVSFGVALLFGTGAAVQVDTVAAHLEPSPTRRVIHEAVVGASGARLLLAAGSAILGLLALMGVESPTLVLTAALGLGISLLLGAASLGDRMPSSRSSS